MDTTRPSTAEEMAKLPIGPAFGMSERIVNGKLEHRPIAPDLVCFYSNATDVLGYSDPSGAWSLGRYADGSWFRQRRNI